MSDVIWGMAITFAIVGVGTVIYGLRLLKPGACDACELRDEVAVSRLRTVNLPQAGPGRTAVLCKHHRRNVGSVLPDLAVALEKRHKAYIDYVESRHR